MPAPDGLQWFKSSYSGSSGSDCVETAHVPGGMYVRDSKDPARGQLAFPTEVFVTFLATLKPSTDD